MKGRCILTAIFIVIIILCIGLDNVEGRGGRGGGARGGSRFGSRSRSSSRSSRTSSVRYYRGPVYKPSMWKAGLAVGVVYGVMSYKRRSIYMRYPNREPKVCFNENNLRNGTYGYFICPEPTDPDNYDYCCGDKGEQSCCTYIKYKEYREEKKTASIVGSIVGIIVIAIIIAVVVYCCIIKKRRQMAAANKVIYEDEQKRQDLPEQQPLAHGYGEASPMQPFNTGPAPPPGAQPYVAPPMGPPTGYDGQPGVMPYNPSPMGPPPPAGQYPPGGDYPQAPPPGGPYPPVPPPGGQYPPPPDGPVPVGFKDGSDGLPYSSTPYPPPEAGGFVPPVQGYPPSGTPNAPPPPYSSV